MTSSGSIPSRPASRSPLRRSVERPGRMRLTHSFEQPKPRVARSRERCRPKWCRPSAQGDRCGLAPHRARLRRPGRPAPTTPQKRLSSTSARPGRRTAASSRRSLSSSYVSTVSDPESERYSARCLSAAARSGRLAFTTNHSPTPLRRCGQSLGAVRPVHSVAAPGHAARSRPRQGAKLAHHRPTQPWSDASH